MNHVPHIIVTFILGIADGKYREMILDIAGIDPDMEGGE